jgi:NAD(P)H dehydrogenase (quinone)
MSRVVIVYHSGFGVLQGLAEAVQAGVCRQPGSQASLLPVEQVEDRWDELHAADGIIFGAPSCMGSLSAPFKAFMDATAAFYLAQPWRDKPAAGFSHADLLCADPGQALAQLALFAAQHGMLWVSLGLLRGGPDADGTPLNRLGSSLGAQAQSSLDRAAESALIRADRRTAAYLGERFALHLSQTLRR